MDSCGDVQNFIDTMCDASRRPTHQGHREIIVMGPMVCRGRRLSLRFWPNEGEEDAGFGRYIVFDGQTCRISGKERSVPIKVDSVKAVVERFHTVIHEFIHHFFHHHFGINTDDHGALFRAMERASTLSTAFTTFTPRTDTPPCSIPFGAGLSEREGQRLKKGVERKVNT